MTEELRDDVRFALRFDVGRKQHPRPTPNATWSRRRSSNISAYVIGRSSELRRGAGLRSWDRGPVGN